MKDQMMEEQFEMSSNVMKVQYHERYNSSKYNSVLNVTVALHIHLTSVISVALSEKRCSK